MNNILKTEFYIVLVQQWVIQVINYSNAQYRLPRVTWLVHNLMRHLSYPWYKHQPYTYIGTYKIDLCSYLVWFAFVKPSIMSNMLEGLQQWVTLFILFQSTMRWNGNCGRYWSRGLRSFLFVPFWIIDNIKCYLIIILQILMNVFPILVWIMVVV